MTFKNVVKLGDFVTIKHGYAFPGKFITSQETKKILVTPGNFNIGGGFKSSKFKYYSGETYPEQYRFNGGELIVTMTDLSKETDTLGYAALVPNDNNIYLHNQRVGLVQILNNDLDKMYLYWKMRTREYQEFIANSASGTSVMHTSPKKICEYEFLLPTKLEQKAIASVLSSLDDKIDLLHRQNKTLESMAETLFRQYFIEEAQEDWEDCNITDLFEVRDGTHASPKQSVSGYPLVTSKHIGSGIIDFNNTYLISEEDYSSINKRSKVEKFDILFSMIGTIGSTHIELSDKINYAIKNVGLLKTSQNHDWKFYTYLWLLSSEGKDFIHATKSGSTQEYISLGSLRSIVFNKPDNNTLRKFNNIAEIHFNKIYKNNKQIITLEKLRDTLLPKLMIGEVRVQYAEEAITSVA
ncbi:restriction endonuclease subunit S [Enterobacter kobei]|uniref:restriction endonuclease subunit S n=1 Tax=Enterobacter kobei TaxID=208224 RepID=UPI0018F33A7E|nr:restriction endonuclease subunit S [Enterobacter kobei]